MGSCHDGLTSPEDGEQASEAMPCLLIFIAASKSAFSEKPHSTQTNSAWVLRLSFDTCSQHGNAARSRTDARANPSWIGRTQNAPLRVATIPNWGSSGSPITARKARQTRILRPPYGDESPSAERTGTTRYGPVEASRFGAVQREIKERPACLRSRCVRIQNPIPY